MNHLRRRRWRIWVDALQYVNNFGGTQISVVTSKYLARHVDVHVFSDASEGSIAALAFNQVTDEFEETSLGFIMGISKLASLKGYTILRLEMCAAG